MELRAKDHFRVDLEYSIQEIQDLRRVTLQLYLESLLYLYQDNTQAVLDHDIVRIVRIERVRLLFG